jgi:D-sedoheptulose 7-phosphate isomerase
MHGHPNAQSVFFKSITDHLEVIKAITVQQELLERIALAMVEALGTGKKILWCGNGGSAADSQHLSSEIVGRFRRDRRGLPSVALTTDTSVLTAVANDYGYEAVFSRQVEALGNPGDVLVGLSTSGNSANVVRALEVGREIGLKTVAFTGAGGGKLASLADFLFAVPSIETARIQEAHGLVGHMLCDWIELDWVQTETQVASAKRESGARID